MIRKEKKGIHWLEFEIFAEEKELVHGVFLRHGGISGAPQDSLNVREEENRRRILDVLGSKQCVFGKQVHEKTVVLVKDPLQKIDSCDALMTQRSELALMVQHADCQAAIIYDPVCRCLSAVHAGWRGNVLNIYRETIQQMAACFGSQPQDLLVGISPSLGPEHAEFKNYKSEFPESFWPFQIKPYYFDLWAIAREQLTACGVLPHHIEIAEICTYANPQDWFSYRRDKIYGRHGTLAFIR